jgi:hypothetical protein
MAFDRSTFATQSITRGWFRARRREQQLRTNLRIADLAEAD